MDEPDQLGNATLRLLCDDCMLVALRQLSAGPTHASDVEASAPGIAHWTARRRLLALVRQGWATVAEEDGSTVRHGRRQAAPPRGLYTLTDAGREGLLKVYEAAVRRERRWQPSPAQPQSPGLWAISVVADAPNRMLARALGDSPLAIEDLHVRVPELTRATLFRRLAALCHSQAVVHDARSGRYALTDQARRLVVIPLLAGRSERLNPTSWDPAALSDLPGLLHVLASLGRVPSRLSGTCHWRFDSGAATESEMFLAVASGHIAALPAPPIYAPSVVSHADPRAWCDALLHGDASGLDSSGDDTLLDAVISALRSALVE